MRKRQIIDNVVTPSPSARASKRYAQEIQRPLKIKPSCAARNTKNDDDDVGHWGNRDNDSSEDGLEKNKGRMKRDITTTGKAIYDMDFNPMDRITRSKMAAAQRVLAKEIVDVEMSDDDGNENSGSNALTNTEHRRSQRSNRGKHSRKLQYSTAAPMKRVAKNLASKIAVVRKKVNSSTPGSSCLLQSTIGEDFEELCSMDKILHNIQHGAPLDSVSLPHSWPKVGDMLINEGFFTRVQYKAWGGAASLMQRYDAVRCAVQGEHAESEEKDTEDQPLYWEEGMDVLDLVGHRTIYQHKGIPDYMKGVEKFSQRILDQTEVEFFRSVDEAASIFMVGSESSRDTSTVADSVVPNTQMTTSVSLESERAPTIQMELETESEFAPLHSEDASVVVIEAHEDQEAAVEIHLSGTASPASPLAHDGLSPVPKSIAPVEHNELGARLMTTARAFIRSPQTPKMKGKINRRSKESEFSRRAFTIHEDSSYGTSRATGDFQGGILDPEDSKENAIDEDDNVEATELAGTDGASDSPIAASERNLSGYRANSENRDIKIVDTPPHPISDLDSDLPPNNLSQTKTF